MACSDKNTLIREGTGRYNRSLAALSPDFAKVDERELRDLLLFIQRYATHIAYFDNENNVKGTWEPFLQPDLSVALATLAAVDPITFTDYYKSLLKRIRLAVKEENAEQAKQCFRFIFDLVYTLVKTIDDQCVRLAEESAYQRSIEDIITTKISHAFRRLFTFKDAHAALLAASDEIDPLAPFALLNSSVAGYTFHYIHNDTAEVLNITIPDTDDLSKIHFIVHHNLFQQQLKAIFAGISSATAKAETLFEKSIGNYHKHKPHMALLLSFLQLFRHAQNQLNEYGRKHLEYYYRDVLQLKSRKAEPDYAHLIFDLHTHTASHLLKAGTLFKGGQDQLGRSLVYRLSQDAVLNQAKVGPVHSLKKGNGALYATENSNEAPLFLFGDAEASLASTGFAIASNLLFLKGGERVITLSIRFKSSVGISRWRSTDNLVFRTLLTGEKGWLEDRVTANYQPQRGELTFSITVDGGKEAIQGYEEKIHQRNMQVSLPLLLIYFDQEASRVAYDTLAEQLVDTVQINVEVRGYKDFVLSNDVGLLDGSKPFKPFGDLPRRNAGFYIGSDELFQKPLTALTLTMDMPAAFSAGYLQRGAWNPLSVTSVGEEHTLNLPGQPIQTSIPTAQPRHTYGSGERDGYIRLTLDSDHYSLSSFMDSLTQSINDTRLMKIPMETSVAINGLFGGQTETEVRAKGLAAAKEINADTATSASLDVAHQEMLKAVTLATQFEGFRMVRSSTPTPRELIVDNFEASYTAVDTVSFSLQPQKSAFFHLYPFGYKQVTNKKLLGLLPGFSNRGELLIGMTQVTSPKIISLLFDVVEGSSNPLKTSEHVSWYYLDHENNWKIFEKTMVADGTVNLTRTGIVTVSFPSDATNAGTVMPSGMLWLKAAVQGQIDAVCKLKAIAAQAGLVELVQDGINNVHFTEIRPKGSIAKLLANDAAIKTINQPADSFGGRPTEPPQAFYTRVSERLRHKQRAITMWDYEHLVLEQFPSIYKVKCINRAGFVEHSGVTEFCENYPGHVTLVTIPDLSKATHTNPLRPYTPIGVLVDITDYLRKISNPFITLHVRNPQFEEIQLEFDVMLRANMDEAFYLNQLNDDIERFLCPWAFDIAKQISFGGKIQKSTLIDFIDERSYVHAVSGFKMHHIIRNEENAVQTAHYDVEEIVASSSRSILVSYANGTVRHQIRVLQNCECV